MDDEFLQSRKLFSIEIFLGLTFNKYSLEVYGNLYKKSRDAGEMVKSCRRVNMRSGSNKYCTCTKSGEQTEVIKFVRKSEKLKVD